MQPSPSKAPSCTCACTASYSPLHAPVMPSRQPPSWSSLPSSSSCSPSSPGAPAAAGCLPADQSCFAVSVSVGAPSYTSRHDAATATASAHACCTTTTSYIAVLGISFGSLLAILLILCAIRWYLVRRTASRDAAEAAAAAEPDKKRSTGMDADAIAALPEFAYRKEPGAVAGDDEAEDERECAVCLGALAEGEAARLLPLCMHVFHRGCVDVWLGERSTCPVCRAEVVARRAGEGCADMEQECGTSRASTSTTAALPPQDRLPDDGERDLEAQLY